MILFKSHETNKLTVSIINGVIVDLYDKINYQTILYHM